MRIGIAANLQSRGLFRDATILTLHLETLKHSVLTIDENHALPHPVDVLVHVERLSWPNANNPARHWLLANPEFIREQDRRWIDRFIDRILCKTHYAADVCASLFPTKDVRMIGFSALDVLMRPAQEIKPRFLHVCGNSRVKGTEAVVGAWRWTRSDGAKMRWPLIVVSDWYPEEDLPEGVKLIRNPLPHDLMALQNSAAVHLQPSETEGFGHALWEAMSLGVPVISTAAPPMYDIGVHASMLLEPCSEFKINYVTGYKTSAIDVFHSARDNEYIRTDPRNREMFLANRDNFNVRLGHCFQDVPEKAAPSLPKAKQELRIAFVGNFSETSTESHIRWALDRLGHVVIPIQEQTVGEKTFEDYTPYVDLLIWVKTPGLMKVDPELVLDFAKKRQIRTMSLHLDKFWGIPDRVEQIGRHPFWRTDVVFTADGGNTENFKLRGVNHRWLRPAVSEVYMHPGTRQMQYSFDVVFVGSEKYHESYSFRPAMIQALREHFAASFTVIEGVRGHLLNDVYASAKVIVGDCIFAGTPHYWSDRVPETFGRQGFMVHPDVPGFDYPCKRYEPQNISSLIETIETSLRRPVHIRRKIANNCFEHARRFDTWTIRMEEILGQTFE